MTVNVATRRAGPYQGNKVTTDFAFDFYIPSADALTVILEDAGGNQFTKVYKTDYTISGIGVEGGGAVSFIVAPTAAYKVWLVGNTPLSQPADYKNQSSFQGVKHEKSFDRATIQIQEFESRALVSSDLINLDYDAKGRDINNVGAVRASDFYLDGVPVVPAGMAISLPSVASSSFVIGDPTGSFYEVKNLNELGIGRVVESISDLKSVDKTTTSKTFVTGYYAAGDGGGGHYYYDASDTTSADNGGTIIVANDGARWKLVHNGFWYVEQFGAKGDGTTDDTVAINAAIAALPARGGTVFMRAAVYRATGPIMIGDGGGAVLSQKQGVKLIGVGAGFGQFELVPTVIDYQGVTVTSPLISVEGRISDIEISGIFIACNGKTGGIGLQAFSGTKIERVKIVNPSSNGIGLSILGGPAPTGNYNIFNRFSQINIALLSPNSIGLFMHGDYSVQNDTWISDFDLVRVETADGADQCVCAWFKFVDSCSFRRCHLGAYPEHNSIGVIFDALENDGFPAGMAFYDCSIGDDPVVYEDATHKIRKNYFYGYGTYDLETPPTHPKLVGITDTGVVFGEFLYGDVWTSYTPTITAASGALTTASASARFKQLGKQVYFSAVASITTNGTGASYIKLTLPAAPGNVVGSNYFAFGRNTTAGGAIAGQFVNGTQEIHLRKLDDTYPGADGAILEVSGFYEVA